MERKLQTNYEPMTHTDLGRTCQDSESMPAVVGGRQNLQAACILQQMVSEQQLCVRETETTQDWNPEGVGEPLTWGTLT